MSDREFFPSYSLLIYSILQNSTTLLFIACSIINAQEVKGELMQRIWNFIKEIFTVKFYIGNNYQISKEEAEELNKLIQELK